VTRTLIAAPASTSAAILKGERPGEMPVELPTKYELVIILRRPERSARDSTKGCARSPDEVIE